MEHNEKYDRGEESFKMAINNFSDRKPEELSNMSTGFMTDALNPVSD
jgi:hypothetical protein